MTLLLLLGGLAAALALLGGALRLMTGPDPDNAGAWDPYDASEWSFQAKARTDRQALLFAIGVIAVLAFLASLTPAQVPA